MSQLSEFDLDPLTAKILSEDLKALEAELGLIDKAMREARTAFDNDMAHLAAKRRATEFKISKYSEGLGAAHLAQLSSGNGAAVEKSTAPQVEPTGFRELIRIVLRESHKGLKPREIAQAMLKHGLAYNASTDLNTRVSNDLRRLIQSGSVRKSRNLFYIQQQETHNGST